MLQIAICDDDAIMTTRIEDLLNRELNHLCVDRTIDVFFSGEAFIDYVEKAHHYDLIYLDIEMDGMNGIDAARRLRRNSPEPLIIYISSYENYFIELFEVEPFRFIKKPVDETTFNKVLRAAYEKIKSGQRYFTYYFNKIYYKVTLQEILYFESCSRVVNIHLRDGEKRFYGRLDEVEKQLDSEKLQFIRIHQSYLVNMDYVSCMGYEKLTLKNGETLQISDKRQKEIREKYMRGWE